MPWKTSACGGKAQVETRCYLCRCFGSCLASEGNFAGGLAVFVLSLSPFLHRFPFPPLSSPPNTKVEFTASDGDCRWVTGHTCCLVIHLYDFAPMVQR